MFLQRQFCFFFVFFLVRSFLNFSKKKKKRNAKKVFCFFTFVSLPPNTSFIVLLHFFFFVSHFSLSSLPFVLFFFLPRSDLLAWKLLSVSHENKEAKEKERKKLIFFFSSAFIFRYFFVSSQFFFLSFLSKQEHRFFSSRKKSFFVRLYFLFCFCHTHNYKNSDFQEILFETQIAIFLRTKKYFFSLRFYTHPAAKWKKIFFFFLSFFVNQSSSAEFAFFLLESFLKTFKRKTTKAEQQRFSLSNSTLLPSVYRLFFSLLFFFIFFSVLSSLHWRFFNFFCFVICCAFSPLLANPLPPTIS